MRILILAIAVAAVRGQMPEVSMNDVDIEALRAADLKVAQAANLDRCPTPTDPNDTALCYPLPTWMQPDPNLRRIKGVTIRTVNWKWVGPLRKTIAMAKRGNALSIRCLRAIPQKFIKAVDDPDLEPLLSEHARKLHILGQWKPDECRTRCKYLHPYLKNAICTATHYRYYKRWMYCPRISKYCKYYPCLCFRLIKFKLPMNCKCLQCWYRGKTRLAAAHLLRAAEEEVNTEDEEEDGTEPPEGFPGDD